MRKITSFLMLLVAFVLTGTSLSAQTSGYKPGERKTSFARGDKMFIYNTSFNGTEDRTGFYRYNSRSQKVEFVKQKPYSTSDKYRYDIDGTSIWTVESVENVGTTQVPIYKMSIKNSADQYLKFDMTYSADVQYVYVRSWANTASGKQENVKSEDAEGVVIEKANIKDSHKVWTVSQAQDGSSNYWNCNASSVNTWGSGHPFAFYTTLEVSSDELASVLQSRKDAVVSGIQTVLTECGVTVKLTRLDLTDKITSNADENTGGGKADGGGIAALIDKTNGEPNLNTYFHSRWDGTEVNEYHYIQVDAGEALSAFAFGYSTRNGSNQDPTAFDIYGSLDCTNWTKIASIDKETFALKTGASATYAQRGFVLPSGKTYRHFRFAVTANSTGGKHGGYPYFALSDFNFSKVTTFSCDERYTQNASVLLNNYLLMQEALDILSGVTDPGSAVIANTKAMVANQFWAEVSKQPVLPFNLTIDSRNKQNYYIKLPSRGNYYLSLRPWDSGKVYTDNTTSAADNAYRYWYFTRSEMTGAIYIHPVTAPTAMLGYSGTGDGAGEIFNNSSATSRKFYFAKSGENNCFRPIGANTYLSNWGGNGFAMGFYGTADGGAYMTFEPAGSLPDNIVDLSAKYAAAPNETLIGTGLNQYNQSQNPNLKAALQEAGNLLKNQATTLTSETIAGKIPAITFTTLDMNQPARNGFYRFRNVRSRKYLTTNSSMAMAENATSAAIFYLTSDNKLVGYDNGYYTKNFTTNNYGFQDASGTGNVVTFPNGNTYTEATACYHINCGNRSIYGNKETLDAGGDIQTNHTDTGYDWTIEAVSALPLTISEVGWSTFYAPVPVTIPAEVTAYTASIEGTTCTLTEVTGTVPANTGLILYMQGGGDVQMTIADPASAKEVSSSLMGSPTTINPDQGYTYYALQQKRGDASKVGLYPYAGELKGFRAFYRAESSSPEANAAGFSFDFITGLESILGTDGKAGSGEIYDLNGRRLDKPVKGLNIIGGKKVLVK